MSEAVQETEGKPLTQRQQEILAYIENQAKRYGPTIREIASAMQISSPNGVVCHLRALEKKGRIRRLPGISRGIEVLQ
jgi:repressor LexA